MSRSYKYFAFISYSRKDGKLAGWLQKRLEWFRFPVKLVPEDRRPEQPPYIRPIYRDKTNLEVTDEHYWKNIRRALEESRFLIVLCSPNSAASGPVEMEVSHFLETHGHDSGLLVPVIVGGSVTSRGENAAFGPTLGGMGDALIGRNLPTMLHEEGGEESDAREQGFVAIVSYLLSLDRKDIGDHIQRETRRQARVLRRWLVAVVALAVTSLVGGAVAYRQKQAADAQTKRAVAGELAAEESARRANEARDGAEQLIDYMTSSLRDKLEVFGRLDLMRDVNARVEDYHKRFTRDDDSPGQIHLRSIFWHNRGETLQAEHDLDAALEAFQTGEALVRGLAKLDPSNELFKNSLGMSRVSIADVLSLQGKEKEALDAAREAVGVLEELTEKGKVPRTGLWFVSLATAYGTLGDVLGRAGDPSAALEEFKRSRATTEFLITSDGWLSRPEPDTLRYQLAMSCDRIGDRQLELKNYEGALAHYRAARESMALLVEKDGLNTLWLNGLWVAVKKIGLHHQELGQLDEALERFNEALGIATRLAEHEPDNGDWQRQLAATFTQLGMVLELQGDVSRAVKFYQKSAPVLEKLFLKDPTDARALEDLLGNCHGMAYASKLPGDMAVAIRWIGRILPAVERMAGEDAGNLALQKTLARFDGILGNLLHRNRQWAKAAEVLLKGLEIARLQLDQPGFDPEWAAEFALAAGIRWDIMRHAPPGTVELDRSKVIADLGTARSVLRALKARGKLDAEAEGNLRLIEKAFQKEGG